MYEEIIAITRSGYTANVVSNAKPANIPIFAFTNSKIVHRQLSLVGSVQSFYLSSIIENNSNLLKIKKKIKSFLNRKKSLKFVVISGMFSKRHSDAIRVIDYKSS